MKIEAMAKLVTIYVNSTDQWHGQPLYEAIVHACKEGNVAGVTVVRGVEGYGGSGRVHTTRLLELSEDLPVRIEFVDLAERVESVLATLEPMIREGLITVADVQARRFLADPK